MRTIVSAYHAAEATRKKMILFWRNDVGCNCSYRELFSLPQNIQTFVADSPFQQKLLNQVPKLLGESRFFTDNDLLQWKREGKSYQMLAKPGSIYIRSCETLYQPPDEQLPPFDYTFFQPLPAILASLPKIFDHPNLIGIHIRRTDNTVSIENSPLELFIENMDREMEKHSGNCAFFLATDDNEIKTTLLRRYGAEHIFTRTGIELSRAAQSGIRDAYIDVLCLSKCSKIYGSYWSSFSECAAEIGNIPLFICKK